jgi:hypothetical protein
VEEHNDGGLPSEPGPRGPRYGAGAERERRYFVEIPNRTIEVGVLSDFSGNFADQAGKGSLVGAQMAAEDFAKEAADHQNRRDLGLSIARRWIEEDSVSAIADLAPRLGSRLTANGSPGGVEMPHQTKRSGLQCVASAGHSVCCSGVAILTLGAGFSGPRRRAVGSGAA